MGWVTSLRNGPTGVGYTFECLLNKKEDTFYLVIPFGSTEKSSNKILQVYSPFNASSLFFINSWI